ncbi:MAG: O-antigen ligase family protein [Patescibacteria group bacterium]|nr:O-antigen ligase family protein [Patescibacteria group bacterium]
MNSQFFFPFIVPKNIAFHITAEVIFIAYLILAHLNSRYRFRAWRSKLVWAVVAFFVINIIASLSGIGLYSSFWGNYERMSGLFHLLHLLLFFLVIVGTFRDKSDWHRLFTFSVFTSILMAFLGFAQVINTPFLLKSSGGQRVTGTVGNPDFFAAYLIFNLFFLLYFIAKEKRLDIKLFFYSFLTFDIIAIGSSILYQLAPEADWGILSFLRTSLIQQAVNLHLFFFSYLLLQGGVAVVWFYRQRPQLIRGLLSVIFIFEFFVFYNTQTRGAIVGLMVGLFVLALAGIFTIKNRPAKIAFGLFLAAIIATPFLIFEFRNSAIVQNNGTLNRLATISTTDITTESRLATWDASWLGWKENTKTFLIGYGPENYYYVFNKYFPVQIYKDNGSQIWFDRAHNIVFDLGVTTGIIGLYTYLLILLLAAYYLAKSFWQNKSISSSWLMVSLLVAYFVQNFFVFDTFNTEILFYLLIGFAVFVSSSFSRDESEPENEVSSEPNYIYLATLIIVLLFGVFAINVRILNANHAIYRALIADRDDPKLAIEDFKKSISGSLTGVFEARQQFSNLATDVAKNKKLSVAEITDLANSAANELEKSVKEEPLNIRHQMWIAAYYNSMSSVVSSFPSRAVDLLEANIGLSPSRPQLYFEIAQGYALTGKLDKAQTYFEYGVDLAPSVIDSRWILMTFYIITGKVDLADAQYQKMLALGLVPKVADFARVVDAYSRVSNYDKMVEFQLKILALEPSAQNYARLAAIYAKMGEDDKAKEATGQAVSISPSFTSQAQQFLQDLAAGKLVDKNYKKK